MTNIHPFKSLNIGACPAELQHVDHRLCNNPYQSKFGEDEWENKMRKSAVLRKYLPVSDLITHMAKCTSDVMIGTKFEGRGYFYHDALSQSTEKETCEWMRTNKYNGRTYWSMWVTPVLGCNNVIRDDKGKSVKCYSLRPVGNMPEVMCLDNSLNQDVHVAVESNVGATYFLPDNDTRKFSLTTPSHIIKGYKRVYCPSTAHSAIPSSRRIIQDVSKVIFALRCIVEARGNVVHGLATREGHRRWVEEYKERSSIGVVVDEDDGDSRGDGDDGDYNGSNGPWLHHDTKCALQEYWGRNDRADGKQVGTHV